MARLIDAIALEEAIITDYWEHFTRYHDTDQIALIDMVCEDIGNAPTVDAVPVVHGRKFLGRHPTNVVLTHQCSKCVAYMIPQDNYCPNCGAKMDLEVE